MPGAMPGMSGPGEMPGAAEAMGGPAAAGGPGAQAAGLPQGGLSMMHPGGGSMDGPGGTAVSQLSGLQIQASGEQARSLLDGQVQDPSQGGVSMADGAVGGPGAPAISQIDGEIHAPGDVTRSLLDGSEQAGGGPGQSMTGEEGASGGPGQSMAGEDGASGGPGAQGGPGAADGDALDDDPLEGSDDEDAMFQAERGEGGGGEGDDDDLVDPDVDRPDFGGTGAGADAYERKALGANYAGDLDDGFDEGLSDKDKPDKKKPKKPIDPAYVTAAVMSIIVFLVGSILYVAQDELSELWPGIKGVYEALSLDDDEAQALRLSQPRPVRIMIGGVQTLVVTGFITNLTEELQNVPNLKLMLVNQDNDVVQEPTTPPTSPTIDPNSTQPYRNELQLPDESATNLRVDWD